MTHIEQLHLDAITSEVYSKAKVQTLTKQAARKSAEITEQIAIEFVLWIYYNDEWVSTKSTKELFQEYLKSKENDK